MRLLSIILACLFVVASIFTPKQLAQGVGHSGISSNRTEDANQNSDRIELSIDRIIKLSKSSVVATIVENGDAYAIGFKDEGFFKTKVWEGASQAYGISAGRLAFSKQGQGFKDEEIFIVDLQTNEQQNLFPDISVARAEWQPKGRTLAAIVNHESNTGLLLYDVDSGRVETLREESVQSDFLRWSDDGETLYFVESEDAQKELYLVRHSQAVSNETRARVDVPITQFLPAMSDSRLQSGDVRVAANFDSGQDDRLVMEGSVSGFVDLKLRDAGPETRAVQNALPVRRIKEGMLLKTFDSKGGHTLLWHFESGKLFALSSSPGAVPNQVTPLVESGLTGAWYLSFPLAGLNPYNRVINSVMDHSVPSGWYSSHRDFRTTAFTGEEGRSVYGVSPVSNDLYKQQSGAPFSLKGAYTGGSWGTTYISYDGHPGFDYHAIAGTDILAPADGTLYIPTSDPINGNPSTYNTFVIDFGNGYSAWILHAQRGSVVAPGTVLRGHPVAKVGNVGTAAVHLHFEIRRNNNTPVDPYGWEGGCQDPYTAAASVNLWTNSGTQWDFNTTGNAQGWTPAHVECYSVNSGMYFIDPQATDPFVQSPPLVNVNASSFNTVEVRMASNAPDGTGSVYFTTATSPDWNENKRVDFTVTRDGNFRTYQVRMNNHSLWSGSITGIRIDPSGSGRAGTNSDTIGFDYIKLTNVAGGNTPAISVTPFFHDYGAVSVGSFMDFPFLVQNTGSGTLSGNASVAAPFSIFSGGSYNLSAGQSQFVTVRFNPTAAQSFTQNVSFSGGSGTSAQVTGTGTGGASSQPAQMTSPPPGSTLSGSTVTFAWSAGTGVSQYWLYVGSSPGGVDIYNANQGTNRSVTVSNIPTDGRPIYVRLWSFIGAGWQWNDYTYTAASAGTPIISVTPSLLSFNSVQVGSSANLNFIVQNVGSGTLSGSASVAAPFSIISGGSYNLTAGQSQSVTVRFSPAAAQFYSQNVTFTGSGGATRQVTGTGTSAGAAPTVATGSATSVTSSSVTLNGTVNPNGLATTIFFQWGTTTSYGNQTGSQSVGSGTSLLGVSANLSGLSTGTTYHYRIVGSNSNGTNVGTDVSFTTSSGGGGTGPAQITIPTPGSTFSGVSVTFAWTSSSAASGYWLFIGSSPGGADIYNQDQGLNLSGTVNGIPTDGRIIYVRLWTFIGGWLFNDYTYRAASGGGGGATNRLLNSSFESGPVNWVQFSSAGFANITNSSGTAARTGSWLAWLGGADNLTEYIYQDVTIPANATQANVQFYYKIVTNEGITTTCFDRLTVEVRRSSDNAILGTLTTRCNNNQTNLWTSSGPLNVFSFRGQTIRLRFIVTTDSSLTTSFFLDDVTLVADGN